MKLKILIIVNFLFLLFISTDSQSQCGSCNKCDDFILKQNRFSLPVGNSTEEQIFLKKTEKSRYDDKKVLKENTDDEFDEFSDFDEKTEQINTKSNSQHITRNSQLPTVFLVMFSVIIAGIFVRFKPTRNLRPIFMIGFLIYLGFYLGACPCPISAYQNVFLTAFGKQVRFESTLYFLGLIPLTYVFGKVWCGWICHLGTFQELIHLHRKFNFLKGNISQRIMTAIRWILFFGLIIQLSVTQTNWFCKIDPFLVAFNFISVYSIGWYLLGLLILTSLFIHRPFCQAACPIGLVLGWVSKIPGAAVLSYNENCTHCNTCYDTCKIGAITKDNGNHFLNNKECNFCGECLDSCEKDAIKLSRKK